MLFRSLKRFLSARACLSSGPLASSKDHITRASAESAAAITNAIFARDISVRASLQYSESEKAHHQATVSNTSLPSFHSSGRLRSTLAYMASAGIVTSSVAATHSTSVLSKSTRRSDLIQNRRTNSQYPDEPTADPYSKSTKENDVLRGMNQWTGYNTKEVHSTTIGVAMLHAAASPIKHNEVTERAALRSRRDTTTADA